MSSTIKKKWTILVPSGPSHHLFVILSDACENNMHLMVSISSIKPEIYHDPTCPIYENEKLHSFITKDSFVLYKYIQARPAAQIAKCMEEKSYIQRDDIPEELFKRICEGVERSPHTPNWAKKQYQNWPKS